MAAGGLRCKAVCRAAGGLRIRGVGGGWAHRRRQDLTRVVGGGEWLAS